MLDAKIYSFEEMLSTYGYLVYTNVGISMLPLLRERKDIIEIRPINGRAKKYDVILYKKNERYILHRVLRVLNNGYIVAGDNNTYVENDINDNMIIGVMVRVIRHGKPIDTKNISYRLYTHIWCDFYKLRMLILRFFKCSHRLMNRIVKFSAFNKAH